MGIALHEAEEFDLKLAIDCAASFHGATGIGCTISNTGGDILYEAGYGCDTCDICATAGERRGGNPDNCTQAHIYGMTEAERFGGKYIYFCPMGLSCFVSPIVGQMGSAAKITVGPFLMVDLEDYIAYDLEERLGLDEAGVGRVCTALECLPYIPPGRVQSLSNLLFMSVGFLNNVSAANRMLDTQSNDIVQGQISAYILELKKQEEPHQYPLQTEQELVASIVRSDRETAQKLLNELLGFILFSSGGDITIIRTKVYELLVVMSRAAIDAGASPEGAYAINHAFITRSLEVDSIDELYALIGEAMNKTVQSVFQFVDIKHVDVIHKAVNHVRGNYDKKITLEEMAGQVYLSPSYFSKVFKAEMGMSFGSYLNAVRIEKSKKLLMTGLRLVEVATMVGFEDQSYFTKVFKRVTGISPNKYKETGGRV